MDRQSLHKKLISTLRGAMYDFSKSEVRKQLDKLFNQESVVRLCYPLGEIVGAEKLYTEVYKPLYTALPDLERRDNIVIAGPTREGADWVGCGGYYLSLIHI